MYALAFFVVESGHLSYKVTCFLYDGVHGGGVQIKLLVVAHGLEISDCFLHSWDGLGLEIFEFLFNDAAPVSILLVNSRT